MKIVVLDGYTENPGDLSWDGLKQFGEVIVYDRTPYEKEEIVKRIGNAEIVITNKCPISKEVIDACANMKFIAVLATGYNVVDIAYAKEKGIPVSNIPSYGTATVAQFAISLLLEICNRVAHHSDAVHEGRWTDSIDWCFWDNPLIELAGKTMGIIGFGRIGQTTGTIAKAMGMKILAYDKTQNEQGESIATYVDQETLLKESDVIVLHCPLLPETEGIINQESISKMKDGVIIINNSRGSLIVEQDLADALHSGKVLAAGVDVVSKEPIAKDNSLLKAPNCFITPHISWAAIESRQRIMDSTIENVECFVKGKPIHVVNE